MSNNCYKCYRCILLCAAEYFISYRNKFPTARGRFLIVIPYLTGRLTISANDNSQIILRWLITLPRLISCFESWFCICFVHPVLSDLSNSVCNDEIVLSIIPVKKKCIFYPLCGCIFCDFLEFPWVKSLKIFTVKMLK